MTDRKTYNDLEKFVYGMTADEAFEKKVCMACRNPVQQDDLEDRQLEDYRRSAMCPQCFGEMMKETK